MGLRERWRSPAPPQGAILPETARDEGSKRLSSRVSAVRSGPFRANGVSCVCTLVTGMVLMLLFFVGASWLVGDAASADNEDSPYKPILFVDFHRSGANSVCRMLDNSTLTVTDAEGFPQQPERNCTTPFSSPQSSPDYFYRIQTCRHLIPYTMDERGAPFHRNNLVVVGVPFFEEMPCQGKYRSFATMRDPIDRLASHIHSERIQASDISHWTKNRTATPADNWMLGFPVVNSMVIRQLLGQDRFVDPRPIDKDDLERAKRAVDRFDVFVPLERLNHQKVIRMINATLPEISEGLAKQNKEHHEGKRQWPKPSGEQLALMEQENKFDIMLYEYVLEKLGID